MHWLDRAAGALVTPRRSRLRFFQGGWGDPGLLDKYRTRVRQPPDLHRIAPRITELRRDGGIGVVDGDYESPVEDLPDTARPARVRLVVPDGARRVCLLLAAWNDGGFTGRMPFARRLANAGVASLLTETAYFGERRAHPAGHPIATVPDCIIMGRAVVEEGIALLRWVHGEGLAGFGGAGEVSLGVSGYSMGGNLAAFLSATSPLALATAPLAASHSPGPILMRGVIRRAIDWEALGHGTEPRARLAAFLGNVSVLNFPAPGHARHAVLVAGRNDGFVPAHVVGELHRHWEGSELRWTPEGHASLLFLRKPTLVRAILDSFERVEASR